MNIEIVINITHFSVSVKQLIGFLRACIWLPADLLLDSRHLFSTLATQLLEYLTSRGLGFGQPVPLHHACCPTSRVFGFPRACFWAAGTSFPRLLPKHPPDRPLWSRLWHIQDSKPRRSTNKSTSPPTKKSPYGLLFAHRFYIRRS